MAYELCMALIRKGKTEGLAKKVDIYFAAERLTEEEYKTIIDLLTNK